MGNNRLVNSKQLIEVDRRNDNAKSNIMIILLMVFLYSLLVVFSFKTVSLANCHFVIVSIHVLNCTGRRHRPVLPITITYQLLSSRYIPDGSIVQSLQGFTILY
jgi:hypothetical protein